MIEQAEWDSNFDDLEEMIRAAGDYLEVSDDLRPRTIETARNHRDGSSAQIKLAALAVLVMFIAMFANEFSEQISSVAPLKSEVSANSDQLFETAHQKTLANVDPSWTLVDSFSELRKRQADFIEDAF